MRYFVVAGMHIIIGMPPHIIIIGAPIAIIEDIASQRSFIRAIIDASTGIIFIIMPSFVISQVILHIIGIMPGIIGIIMGMPFIIMPFIIGIMPFIGIIMGIMPFMPPIIGIMPFMPPMPPIIGIMPFMGMLFIGMLFMGMLFIGIPIIEPVIGMAFIASFSCIEGIGRGCIDREFVRAFTRLTLLPRARCATTQSKLRDVSSAQTDARLFIRSNRRGRLPHPGARVRSRLPSVRLIGGARQSDAVEPVERFDRSRFA